MKTRLIYLLIICLSYAQHDIFVESDLNSFDKYTDQSFYFVYEIDPKFELENHTYWNFHTNDDSYLINDLRTDPSHILIFLMYQSKSKKITMSSIISNNNQYVDKKYPIVFAGVQSSESGYEFLKKRVDNGEESLATYYIYHDPNRAFNDYKMMYNNTVRNESKKNILYWMSRLGNDDAFNFIENKYNIEDYNLRKSIIFCFNRFGKKGYKKLLDIVTSDSDRNSKEARFWLANSASKEMEKTFSEEIYSKEELSLRESAIFSLYNMKDIDRLKIVVQNSKDIRLRKKAMFWLGQSHSVKAQYFADILGI